VCVPIYCVCDSVRYNIVSSYFVFGYKMISPDVSSVFLADVTATTNLCVDFAQRAGSDLHHMSLRHPPEPFLPSNSMPSDYALGHLRTNTHSKHTHSFETDIHKTP